MAAMLEIGRIGRPHGLNGEVRVRLVSNRPERLERGSRLQSDLGCLEVASARDHGRHSIVAFVGIDSRGQAESLRGLALRAAPIRDPGELWVHELVGAEVVDQSGTSRGMVKQVVANPASDLLELADGALVPACFVTAVEPRVQVSVAVPDGLFEASEVPTGTPEHRCRAGEP